MSNYKYKTKKIKQTIDVSKYFTPLSGLYPIIVLSFFILVYRYVFYNPYALKVLNEEIQVNALTENMCMFLAMMGVPAFFVVIMVVGDFIVDMHNYFENKEEPLFTIKLKQAFQLAKLSDKFCPSIITYQDYFTKETTIGFMYGGQKISGSFMSYYFLYSASQICWWVNHFNKFVKNHIEKNKWKVQLKEERAKVSKEILSEIISELQKLEED